ncbi:ABC transporter substrate-binding protein, partial [Akkermansia muciniphila]
TEPVYVAANEAYKKAYNTEIDQFGMGSYDVMMMFIEACKEVGADRAKIKDWLLNMKDFEGSSGLYTMTENGDPLKPCYPMIIEDGKFIEYKK